MCIRDSLEADLILKIVDYSDEDADLHLEAVNRVLDEIGAGEQLSVTVNNKCDRFEAVSYTHLIMADASNKQLNSIWTPANVVTCVRILFIPLFMALALLSHHGALDFDPALSLAAFVLYMLLSLTDKVDGYLARSRNEITDFGKFLDPIADKLLVFSALLILLQQNTVNIWFVFIDVYKRQAYSWLPSPAISIVCSRSATPLAPVAERLW